MGCVPNRPMLKTIPPKSEICQNPENLDASRRLGESIIGFEGIKPVGYQNPGDVPTMGVGSTAGVEVDRVYTHAEIKAAFAADIEHAEDLTRTMLDGLPVSQQEFDALVDLNFNVKTSSLTEKNSPGLHAAIAAADYDAIASNLVYTSGPRGTRNGLIARSQNRVNMFQNGDYSIGRSRYGAQMSEYHRQRRRLRRGQR